MDISFVRADIFDLPYIADVCESIAPMYAEIMPGAFERQAKIFRSAKEMPPYEVWFICAGEQKVGFIGVNFPSTEVVYLVALYLHKDYHRQGFGSASLEYFCEEMKERGYREATLSAHKQAYWATNFYLKHGFTIIASSLEEVATYRDGLLIKYGSTRTHLMRRKLD